MNDNTQNADASTDLEDIKRDLKSLYEHTSSVIGKKTDGAKVKWIEAQSALEVKMNDLEKRRVELVKAGSAASADMKSGFSAALAELKKAFVDAKNKFDEN